MQINSFNQSKKIVIKIGSSLIINKKGGVKKQVLKNISEDIDKLLKKKKEVIVVSSGAIALGKKKLGLPDKINLNQSQAAAARGQIELITSWKNEFKKLNRQVAHILLFPSDTQNLISSSQISFASFNAISKIFSLFTPESLLIILSTAHSRLIAVGLDLIKSSADFFKKDWSLFSIIAKTNP